MNTYQKPDFIEKKVKVNFFLTNISFWDTFGSFGKVYAQSGSTGANDAGGNNDPGTVDTSPDGYSSSGLS